MKERPMSAPSRIGSDGMFKLQDNDPIATVQIKKGKKDIQRKSTGKSSHITNYTL